MEPRLARLCEMGRTAAGQKGSSVRKKKAVIACVRLFFIDQWRLNTGRTTLEALGLRPKAKAQSPTSNVQQLGTED